MGATLCEGPSTRPRLFGWRYWQPLVFRGDEIAPLAWQNNFSLDLAAADAAMQYV